jgi:tellurite resistance-related uncharacterized protein
MRRGIVRFVQDEHADWAAVLDCGHRQHTRHQPPFVNRPWVETEAGRTTQLGKELDCLRCDRFELPEGFVAYKRTPEFTQDTIPKGLTKNHSTKRGVWARINVIDGRLRYRVAALDADFELAAGTPGIVIPEVLHHVEPVGAVRFYVEFYRAADAAA